MDVCFRYRRQRFIIISFREMSTQAIDITPSIAIPMSEIEFRTARSGGKGGQHVNKVETKVELIFDASHSRAFTDVVRVRVVAYLEANGRTEGIVRIISQRSRSQWQNKLDAIEKLKTIIKAALRPVRKRRRTAPTKAAKFKRLDAKRHRGDVKRQRSRSAHPEE
jgi:ribosome-associated protein